MRWKVLTMSVVLLFMAAATAFGAAESVTGKYILDNFNSMSVGQDYSIAPKADTMAGLHPGLVGQSLSGTQPGSVGAYLSVYYPQLSGSAEVDAALKAYADNALAAYAQEASEAMNDGVKSVQTLAKTFMAVKPSDKYVSVIFSEFIDQGGARPDSGYEAHTYNLASGKEVTLEDVFPDQGKLGAVAAHINTELDRQCQAANTGKDACTPAAVDAEAVESGMKNLVFTPSGLVVLYSPGEQGAYVEGGKYVEINRETLSAWGVPDDFWK